MGNSQRNVHLALILVQVLFGLNYVISKVVVGAFPPLVWASSRALITAVIILSIAQFSGRERPKGNFQELWGPLILFSFLGIIINQGCFLVGLRFTTSTNSAILNTLIPIFTLLLVTARRQESMTMNRGIGFVSAFAGVLSIRKIEEFSLTNHTMIGDILTIVNCVSYAFFLSYGKKFMERYDRLWLTGGLFLVGGVGLTIAALPDYFTLTWPQMTTELWGCAIYAIIGGTLLAYFLNNYALAHTNSSNVALWIYIQPVIAAFLAWAWKDEVITVRTLLSGFLIFVGLLLGLSHPDSKVKDLKEINPEV